MTTYQHTDDGEDEPTLWFRRDSYPHWQPLLRRVDLPPDARGLWADVVAGVLSRSDGQAVGVLGPGPDVCGECMGTRACFACCE